MIIKEEKTNKSKGGLRVDVDIKMITVSPGEDNANDVIHPQRFMFRTPLSKPDTYWKKYPIKGL